MIHGDQFKKIGGESVGIAMVAILAGVILLFWYSASDVVPFDQDSGPQAISSSEEELENNDDIVGASDDQQAQKQGNGIGNDMLKLADTVTTAKTPIIDEPPTAALTDADTTMAEKTNYATISYDTIRELLHIYDFNWDMVPLIDLGSQRILDNFVSQESNSIGHSTVGSTVFEKYTSSLQNVNGVEQQTKDPIEKLVVDEDANEPNVAKSEEERPLLSSPEIDGDFEIDPDPEDDAPSDELKESDSEGALMQREIEEETAEKSIEPEEEVTDIASPDLEEDSQNENQHGHDKLDKGHGLPKELKENNGKHSHK